MPPDDDFEDEEDGLIHAGEDPDQEDDDSPFDTDEEEDNLVRSETREAEQKAYHEEDAGDVGEPDLSDDSPFEDDEDVDPIAAKGRDDDDDGEEKYSQRVSKRINKEVSKTKAAEAAARAQQDRADNFENQLRQQQMQQIDNAVMTYESQEVDLNAEYIVAAEAGDTTRQAAINDQLMDAKLNLRQARAAKDQMPAPNAKPASGVNPNAAAWLAKHESWWSDPEHQGVQGFMMGLDSKMAKAGLDKYSPEYFEKLDQALLENFPKVAKLGGVEPAGRRNRLERKKTTTVASSTRERSSRRQNPDRIKLTRADRQQMRTFGLDPNNADHLKEFLKQRRNTIRAQQRDEA